MRRRSVPDALSPLQSDIELEPPPDTMMEEMRNQMLQMQQEIYQLRAAAAAAPTTAPVYQGPSASDIARELTKVGKLDSYNGTPEKCAEWEFTFMGYIGGMSEELFRLIHVSKHSKEPVGNPLDESGRALSARLYQMLTMLLKKSAHKILRTVPQGHGVEAFRRLSLRFGNATDDIGTTGMLNQILNYKF